MNIHFLFGTETGSAEMLCEDIRDNLGDGFEVELSSLGDVDPATLDGDTFYFFVSSTYGNGDLPVTAQPSTTRSWRPTKTCPTCASRFSGLGTWCFRKPSRSGPSC